MNGRLQEWRLKPGQGFVFYRVPGKAIRLLSGSVETNPIEPGQGFLMVPFDRNGESPTILIKPDFSKVAEDFQGFDPTTLPPLPAAPDLFEISKAEYLDAVRKAVDEIKRGVLTKVVLSRLKTVVLSGFDPVAFFGRLCETYPGAFCYLLWTPQSGMWCGATPETLVRYEKDHWKTMALAGTLPKEDPDWSEKEYTEQRLVTETIEANLQTAGYVVRIGERHTREAGNVVHLATEIEIDAPATPEAGMAIAKLLHPTPAVGGLPTGPALELIWKLENRDRKYYTGYLGPVGLDSPAELFVNLRCCQLFKDKMVMHLGGGITTGSEPEREWDETGQKGKVLLSVVEKLGNKA